MKKSILMTIGVFLLCWYMSAFAFGLVTWFLWGGFEYYYPAPLLLVTSIIAVVFYRRDECNSLEAVILSIAAGFILSWIAYLLTLLLSGPEYLKAMEQYYLDHASIDVSTGSFSNSEGHGIISSLIGWFGTPGEWSRVFMSLRVQAAQIYQEISLGKLSFGHIVFLITFLGIPSLGIASLMVAATQIVYNAGSFIRKQFVPLETQ
ncbi:hypothetical protein [Slackia exigua]|uniref:hypothetical protein n=1 Tax=Slackia exigua TaxID=84109 RepID=UPI002004A2AF|nr:hypothetical protein [Slackia exigua]MCK6138373.1 hypothetical protein [Slackia exigua]